MSAPVAKPAARERDLWERLVNSKFEGKQPILSGEESIAAAKQLYRRAMGKAFTGKIKLTSGNRYTWVRQERDPKKPRTWVMVMSVNPDKREVHARGLRALIHDLSHYCHRQLHPNDSAHSSRQAYLERDLVDFAIARGFADGALRKEPPAPKPKPDPVRQRYGRMVARRDKWAAELKRAERLLAKATAEVRQYERRHGDRLK